MQCSFARYQQNISGHYCKIRTLVFRALKRMSHLLFLELLKSSSNTFMILDDIKITNFIPTRYSN